MQEEGLRSLIRVPNHFSPARTIFQEMAAFDSFSDRIIRCGLMRGICPVGSILRTERIGCHLTSGNTEVSFPLIIIRSGSTIRKQIKKKARISGNPADRNIGNAIIVIEDLTPVPRIQPKSRENHVIS